MSQLQTGHVSSQWPGLSLSLLLSNVTVNHRRRRFCTLSLVNMGITFLNKPRLINAPAKASEITGASVYRETRRYQNTERSSERRQNMKPVLLFSLVIQLWAWLTSSERCRSVWDRRRLFRVMLTRNLWICPRHTAASHLCLLFERKSYSQLCFMFFAETIFLLLCGECLNHQVRLSCCWNEMDVTLRVNC